MASRKKSREERPERTTKAPKIQPPTGAPLMLTVICLIIVAGAATIPYANSLNGELFYDNILIISQNPVVTKESNTDKIFTSSYWAGQIPTNLYRPITILSYHLQYVNFGCADDPQPYHVFNFVLHTMNALLVFAVVLSLARTARKFIDDRFNVLLAAFGGALFAAHPITTEAATNIVGRADMLAMLFLLCGFRLHMGAGGKSGGAVVFSYVVAGLCLGAGMLSKESAFVMVGAAAAYDLLFLLPRRAGGRSFWKWALGRLASCYWIYVVVLAGWLAARYAAVGDVSVGRPAYVDNPLAYMPFLQREATAVAVLGLYLWRMLWPATLSADYSPEQIAPVLSAGDWRLLATVGALALIGLAVAFAWKRSRLAAFFILFFFIGVFPISNIVLIIGTIAGERLLYLPSLGWAGVIAVGASYLFSLTGKQWGVRSLALPCALVAVITGLYGYRTFVRNNDWLEETTFWAKTYETSPRSVRTLQGYAEAIQRKGGDLQRSRDLLETALSIYNKHVPTYVALGRIYVNMAQKARDARNSDEERNNIDRAYEVLKRGAALDRIRQEDARRELQSRGKDVSSVPMGNLDLNAMMANVSWRRAQYLLEHGRPQEAEDALVEARASLRVTILNNCFPPALNLQYAEVLMRTAAFRRGDEREHLLEEAAVSACRAVFFVDMVAPKLHGDAWRDLARCYEMLGYNADSLISPNPADPFKDDDKGVNLKFKTRALRSVILIVRANEVSGEELKKVLSLEGKYGVPPSALRSALNGPVSFDEPRLLTGEE